eukprot:4805834-Pleurochrysis_carterae.AAC.1
MECPRRGMGSDGAPRERERECGARKGGKKAPVRGRLLRRGTRGTHRWPARAYGSETRLSSLRALP